MGDIPASHGGENGLAPYASRQMAGLQASSLAVMVWSSESRSRGAGRPAMWM